MLRKKQPFFIVGIGASAGGLEAISQMLVSLAPDTGMAFVLIQHLAPNHESLTVEILSRKTKMPVVEIKNGMSVTPNQVYVLPPDKNLNIHERVLKLSARSDKIGLNLPINSFFESLAIDQKTMAIGIILSGTASDGTQGLEMIKAEGGLAITQDPTSAKFDSMPLNAISSGVVDLVLLPNRIGEGLVRIARHPILLNQMNKSKGLVLGDGFTQILALLQKQIQVDFTHYKHSTLIRRINRRMVVHNKKNYREYYEFLKSTQDETKILFDDVLINVTGFFRDPEVFITLKKKILPALTKEKTLKSSFRIWVVGCSTGEEVYSIAILLIECLGEESAKAVQIFATDISEKALQKARSGSYPESISEVVSEERLQHFFDKISTGYKIKKYIRDMCLFSRHDVSRDPPFSKLDLVSCRNLLIYFDVTLQKQVLSMLNYSLNPGGFLLLGKSETIGSLTSLFGTVDKTKKFYCRKNSKAITKFQFPSGNYVQNSLNTAKIWPLQNREYVDVQALMDQATLSQFAPPEVLVNSDFEVILTRGELSPYLQLPSGPASLNLFKLARAELITDLRMALRTAKKQNCLIKREGIKIMHAKLIKTLNISVVPIEKSTQNKELYFLIFFEAQTKALALETETKPARRFHIEESKRTKILEKELTDVKRDYQTLVEDFETNQEEVSSASEELQSTNEEFQSTNEELETAKEELQSTNEELMTVNDELHERNTNLNEINNDVINLLGSIEIPIVMVSLAGKIRRFTPKAGKLLNLIPGDIGRPIGDIKPSLELPNLQTIVSDVIKNDTLTVIEVQDKSGHWFRLQARPYKSSDNKTDGVVIVLVDIEHLKAKLQQSKTALEYRISVSDTVQLPLVVLDKKLHLTSANKAFYERFNISDQETGKDFLTIFGAGTWQAPELRDLLMNSFTRNQDFKEYEITRNFKDVGLLNLMIGGSKIQWVGEESDSMLLSIQDITHRRKIEKERDDLLDREQNARANAENANYSKDLFLATLSHELRTPLTSILLWSQLIQNSEIEPEKLKHAVQSIEQNALIQGKLIDDLLDISRIQAGKLALDMSVISPADSIKLAVESVRLIAENKSVLIETHFDNVAGNVLFDPARLQQVVWNLLTNAIKFSSQGGTIHVHLEPLEKQGQQYIAIKVIDQGKGIKQEFLTTIFKRFSQEDSTSTRIHGGLGLGLALVYDLLKMQHGTISAESEGDCKGSTFTVLLPKVSAELKTGSKEANDNPQKVNLTGLLVLIVDDQPSSLEAITESLKYFGAKTVSANSAQEAFELLKNARPDVILCDIAMPGEDGFSLIQRIRAWEHSSGEKIPAIAFTAYAAKEDIARVLASGFQAHLAKPVNAAQLAKVVAKFAKKKRFV
jgi:two-component system CheB/CheR fusion protein